MGLRNGRLGMSPWDEKENLTPCLFKADSPHNHNYSRIEEFNLTFSQNLVLFLLYYDSSVD